MSSSCEHGFPVWPRAARCLTTATRGCPQRDSRKGSAAWGNVDRRTHTRPTMLLHNTARCEVVMNTIRNRNAREATDAARMDVHSRCVAGAGEAVQCPTPMHASMSVAVREGRQMTRDAGPCVRAVYEATRRSTHSMRCAARGNDAARRHV
ncbi:hypothetical protein EVAR_87158_1 [Eumeta japonica]|uniref:Uncharacterized protein n=1 Tax=Eumeta variegata TaxID=151549 RepID=A0A4C1VXP3_EUMVA|nr:hypothetical protein EVAR_87158_1 [Eumeta japonica]